MRAVRADRPARRRMAGRATERRRHRRCRSCLKMPRQDVLSRRGGRLQFLGVDGAYHDIARPAGRAAAGGHQARRQAGAEERLRRLWDIGDGVVCFEFTSQKQRARRSDHGAAGRDHRHGEAAVQGAGDLQRGRAISPLGANLGLALFAANIAAWGEIEKSIAAGQKTLKAMKYAPFPVVARAVRHGARRRLRDRAACRRGAGACRDAISAWSSAASG